MERRKEGHHTIPARQFLPNQTMPDHTMPNCSTMSYYNIVPHHAFQPPNGLPNQTKPNHASVLLAIRMKISAYKSTESFIVHIEQIA